MTVKAFNRDDLKRACLAALDAVALEHPAGHQGKLAARYVLHTRRSEAIELMFEKGPKTPAHLWMGREAGEAIRRTEGRGAHDAGRGAAAPARDRAALPYQREDNPASVK